MSVGKDKQASGHLPTENSFAMIHFRPVLVLYTIKGLRRIYIAAAVGVKGLQCREKGGVMPAAKVHLRSMLTCLSVFYFYFILFLFFIFFLKDAFSVLLRWGGSWADVLKETGLR
jgi:hypothetical protein